MPPTSPDGEPVPPTTGEDETIIDGGNWLPTPPGGQKRQKVYVDGVHATIIAERVEYLDENGRLVTESLRDFTKRHLVQRFASLGDFLKRWKGAERKQAVIDELEAEGLPLEPLLEEVGKDLDPFDLICHIAFDQPPLTRRERAESVRKRDIFTKYGPQARAVLDALLTKYRDEGRPQSRRPEGPPNTAIQPDGNAAAAHPAVWWPIRIRASRPSDAGRHLRGSRLAYVCPHHRKVDPGHHAQGHRSRR